MGYDGYPMRAEDEDLTSEDEAALEDTSGWIGRDSYFVSELTGEDFRQYWMTPETIRAVYEAFVRSDLEAFIKADDYFKDTMTVGQAEHYLEFFRVCAERGLGLSCSW